MRIHEKIYKDGVVDSYVLSDGTSVSRKDIKGYQDKLQGVRIFDDGAVIADYAIADISDTKNTVLYDFKRDVRKQLKSWLEMDSDLVLFIEGMRQVGKTYEIKRFAKENFQNVVYINLSVDKMFINAVDNRGTKGLLQVVSEYCIERGIPFTNDKKTILIVDEVQISLNVFNLIREINEKLLCCKAMTGSYLGFVVNRESFHAAGGMCTIEMIPLTFQEFCKANKVEYKYSDETKDLYEIYRQIGGFPGVVTEYIKNNDISRCLDKIKGLWNIFCRESDAYIEATPCEELFRICMQRIVCQMANEKTGFKELIDEKMVETMTKYLGDEPLVSNKELKQGFTWLVRSGILGKCPMYKELKSNSVATDMRYYIRDVGLANYVIRSIGVNSATREGMLTETFAYNELRNSASGQISGGIPNCLYVDGFELDFIFKDITGDITVALEVKTKNSGTKSLTWFRSNCKTGLAIKSGMFKYQVNKKRFVNYTIYLIGGISIENINNDSSKI